MREPISLQMFFRKSRSPACMISERLEVDRQREKNKERCAHRIPTRYLKFPTVRPLDFTSQVRLEWKQKNSSPDKDNIAGHETFQQACIRIDSRLMINGTPWIWPLHGNWMLRKLTIGKTVTLGSFLYAKLFPEEGSSFAIYTEVYQKPRIGFWPWIANFDFHKSNIAALNVLRCDLWITGAYSTARPLAVC